MREREREIHLLISIIASSFGQQQQQIILP